MSDTRSSAGGLTAALLTFGLIAGALGGSLRGGSAAPQGTNQASAGQGSRAESTTPAATARFDGMGARLIALSLGDTAAAPAAAAYAPSQLDVLVVTLPDPIDSHEDWVYDTSLEALRRAHERAGYVIDRMWLPWASRDSVLDGGTRVREAYPGVLLFRAADEGASTPEHPQYRLVYLVGEVSTAGVHPRALRTALAERDRLLGPRTPNTLAVVGPSFSASAAGLGKRLDAWRSEAAGRRVQVITGSATNGSNRGAFPADAGFAFGSTVNSNETLFSTLENVILPTLGIDTVQLAILTEGSAYARELGENDPQAKQAQHPLRLTFPMNIGSLRAETPAAARAAGAGQGEPQPRVPLTLSDAARPMESPPVASRLTVAAIDLTLDQLAQTLRTHNVRAIVIAATDIRDRIFLMTELRQRLRDIHFFALEANALYSAPEYRDELRGMVVVSTYSLLPETQTWGGGASVVPFTGEYAQGVYNATLLQIGARQLLDYQFPVKKEPPHPPVWITALGSTGMVPLRVLRSGDGYALVAPAREGAVAEPDPRADFVSVASYLALLAAAALVAVRSALRLRRREDEARAEWSCLAAQETAGGSWLARLAPEVADRVLLFRRARWGSLRYQQQLYRFLAAVTVAAAAVPSGSVFAAAVLRSQHLNRSVAGMVAVTAAVAVLAILVALAAVALTGVELLLWWRVHRKVFRRRSEAAPRGWGDMWRINVGARRLVLALGLLYLALALAFAAESWLGAGSNPVWFTLLFYRATRLDSGLSPLAPLLVSAAGFMAWTAWHQRRVRALRQMTAFEAAALSSEPDIALADVDAGDAADEPADAAHVLSAIPPRAVRGMRQVRERLFRMVPDWRGMGLAAVLTVVTLYVWLGADPTLERLSGTVYFGNLYLFGLAAMLAATAWGVYRLLSVWSGLRRVLQSLSGTPLVTAFERLPTRVSRLARLGFVSVPHSAVVAPVSALQWRHLVAATRALRIGQPAAAPAEPEAAPAPTTVSVPVTVDETGRVILPGPGTVAEATNGSTLAVAVALAPPPAPARADKPAPSEEETRLRAAVAEYMRDRGEPQTGFGTCGDEGPHGDHLLRLAGVLEAFWEVEPDAKEFGHVAEKVAKGGGPSVAGQVRRSFGEPLRTWLAAAEEYAAVQVVDYVEWVVAQLRVLALFLFAALVLTTTLLSTYPYEPQSLVKLVFFIILLASVGGLLRVSVEMNRDEVLSRVAKTEPGKLTWDRHFLMNGLVFGIVPIATLVSSEFPAVREFLFAWIYPLTRLLGGGG